MVYIIWWEMGLCWFLFVGEKWEQLESNGVVILSISMVNKNFKDMYAYL
jgi:hypothetical protein